MKFKDIVRIITTPRCWLQNDSYSPALDAMLNNFMSGCNFENIEKHTASIAGVKYWIANHPYASFTLDCGIKGRPSRITILKAYEKLVADKIAELNIRASINEIPQKAD